MFMLLKMLLNQSFYIKYKFWLPGQFLEDGWTRSRSRDQSMLKMLCKQ